MAVICWVQNGLSARRSSTNVKKVLFIQHGDTDKPGILQDVLESRGVGLQIVRPYLGERVPDSVGSFVGLAVGGGGQGVYERDKYPYLTDEIALIRQAAADERPVLGLCLGGQLLAASLGADVRRGPVKEIGFFPVELDPITDYDPLFCGLPKSFVTTHWHGDIFDVPPGGMRLGRSALTPNQLFRYGHALYGLQFHLEMTPEILAEMVDESREDLNAMGLDADLLAAQARECLPGIRELAGTVFSRWADFL
ncbi:MAG: GMP synthase [Terrimicrobiaceae bacterium]